MVHVFVGPVGGAVGGGRVAHWFQWRPASMDVWPGMVAGGIAQVVQPCPVGGGRAVDLQLGDLAVQRGALGPFEMADRHARRGDDPIYFLSLNSSTSYNPLPPIIPNLFVILFKMFYL